jgi:hypothetical protein
VVGKRKGARNTYRKSKLFDSKNITLRNREKASLIFRKEGRKGGRKGGIIILL